MSNDGGHGFANIGDRAKEIVSSAVGLASATTLGATNSKAYVDNAAISDSYVVAAARVAEQRSTSPEIRELAARLGRDHFSTRASLHRDAERHGESAATSLDARHQGLVDILERTEPKDFDAVFLHQMTAAHTEAIALHQGFANHGDDAQHRQLAIVATPIFKSHLEAITALVNKAAA